MAAPDRTGPLVAALEEARGAGLVGPGAVEAHVAHARDLLGLAEGMCEARQIRLGSLLDLGSGGGLPGLVVAVLRPELRVTLLDGRRRSGEFLRRTCERLGLDDHTEVVEARAERFARDPRAREQFDLVTARSVGPPPVVSELASAFVRPGGGIAVSEAPTGGYWDAHRLQELGCELGPLLHKGAASVRWIDRVGPIPDRVPRRQGIPAKRPLW